MKNLKVLLNFIPLIILVFSFSTNTYALNGVTCDTGTYCCPAPKIVEITGGCHSDTTSRTWIGGNDGSCQLTPDSCPKGKYSCDTGDCTSLNFTDTTIRCNSWEVKIDEDADGNPVCSSIVKIIEDPKSSNIYKLWLEGIVGRLIYTDDKSCGDGQIITWDATSSKWICADNTSSPVWTKSDTDVYYNDGNVGIGTESPVAPLDVRGNIRGGVRPTDEVIGENSTAVGNNTEASNYNSTAMGYNTLASGSSSTAIGVDTIASGNYSTAMGDNTLASGYISTTMGINTIASGGYSIAMGSTTESSGNYSTAMGNATNASGDASTAMGINTESSSYASVVLGRYNKIVGTNDSWVDIDPLFVVGNGLDTSHRHNALTVLKNGNVGIGTDSLNTKLEVNGITRINNDTSYNWPSSGKGMELAYVKSNNTSYIQSYDRDNNIWGNLYLGNGNVGIGTSSPTKKLHVIGDSQLTGDVSIGTSLSHYNLSVLGKVGIGTASPTAPLSVYSSDNDIVKIKGEDHALAWIDGTDGSEKSINFSEGGALKWKIGMDNSPSETTNDFIIKQANNSDPEFIVKTNGKVGIGTDSPWSTLDVNGNFRVLNNSMLNGGVTTLNLNMGSSTITNGGSIAIGTSSEASASSAVGIGFSAKAKAVRSFAFGNATTTTGEESVAFGGGTTAQAYRSLVIGEYNEVKGNTKSRIDTDPVFVVGNGLDTSHRHNALTVLKNGNVGLGISNPEHRLTVNGNLQVKNGHLYFPLKHSNPSALTINNTDSVNEKSRNIGAYRGRICFLSGYSTNGNAVGCNITIKDDYYYLNAWVTNHSFDKVTCSASCVSF